MPGRDESSEMTVDTDQPSTTPAPNAGAAASDMGRLVRPAAVLALATLLVGRVLPDALKGSVLGGERLIETVDLVAGACSQLLAFVASALSIGLMLSIGRDHRLSAVTRAIVIPQASLLLLFGLWASRARLTAVGAVVVGALACSIAIASSIQAMKQARSRALGVVLCSTAVAGALHLGAAALISVTGERALRYVPISGSLATASLVVYAVSLLVALVWLASRRRTVMPPATLGAMAAAVLVVWAALRASHPGASRLLVFASRALDRLVPIPEPAIGLAIAMFLAVLGPALAITALVTRRQIPSVIGALALTLTAGVLVDSPLHAMLLSVAGLAALVASRDERGMWEVLIGRPLPSPGARRPT